MGGRAWRMGVALGMALGIALVGCGGDDIAPRWTALARDFRPRPLVAFAQRCQSAAGLDPASCSEEPEGVVVSHPLAPAAWRRGEQADTWVTPIPGGAFGWGSLRLTRLRSEHESFQQSRVGELEVNRFRFEGGELRLRLASGTEPPPDLLLSLRLETGRLPPDGVWQVRVGDEYGAGIPVWTGLAEELVVNLPPASQLSFGIRFVPGGEGPVTLRVKLDGQTVHEGVEESSALSEGGRWLAFDLPKEKRSEARLSFEAEGPPGQVILLHPVLGPAQFGSPAQRPWPNPRPNIVILLADTFRADGLAAWGGAPDLAPALNRFAAEARRFRQARSNAAWTLPSIGTLLTGLAPGQHTANDSAHALPGELTTLAERLALAGYRTGAVTDAAFFTPVYGLEQGFESFVINQPAEWDLDRSVERAREFLARDDGRPIFLLVHTYRTHMPYRVGPEEDLRPWRELLDSGCALLKLKGKIPREEWQARLAGCRDRYIELYAAGLRDLDRGFGELLGELDRAGISQNGFVLFTSDHGEALGENQDLFHDGDLWESKLRIPLAIRGPGLAPGDSDTTVTLLDVAPTLAEIAGFPRDPLWPGTSLLSATGERPACAFLLKKPPQVAVMSGGRKLIADGPETLARGEFEAAYDLTADPLGEEAVTDQAWPAEMARRHADLVRALLVPATLGVETTLSGAQRRELSALGYGGEDE